MLGGWGSAPVYFVFCAKRRIKNVEDNLAALFGLINSFSPEDKDKILEILKLALEIVHSPFNA